MLPGPEPAPISEWTAIARVNGIEREVASYTFDSAMENDLPESVSAVSGGVGGTTGTITWGLDRLVTERAASPWNRVAGWPPRSGETVELWVSDGTTTHKRGTWLIDKTTGDFRSGFKSSVIDKRDQITGTFTHEALLRHMTPFLQADASYRSVGLNFWYPLTMALRACDFFNVPPIEPLNALSVPLQGSVWPEAGTVQYASGQDGKIHASFYRTDWGYAAGALDCWYIPRLREPSTTPLQITMVVAPTHAGNANIDVHMTNNVVIRFLATSSRRLIAHMSVSGGTSWEYLNVVTLEPTDSGDFTTATLLVKNGVWTIATNATSVRTTGTRAVPAATVDRIRLSFRDAARVAGVQVSHPNSVAREFSSIPFEPNMVFTPSGLASTMDMMPAQKSRSISALVNEILESTLTASWWDEEGRLVLMPSDLLRGAAPSAELSDDFDITAMGWEDALGDVRSGVEVEWQDPEISKSRWRRQELWRGEENRIGNGDDIKQFVEPESGEEWFGVDRTIRQLDASSWGAYNDRLGSYAGVWFSNNAGDEVAASGSVNVTSDNLYTDSLIIYTTASGLATNVEGNTGTSPEAISLRPQYRGEPLPVVRGFGRGQWVDRVYRATPADAVPGASVMIHSLGYWGQRFSEDFEGAESVAQRMGDFLARILGAPLPRATGIDVMYDPRRQVGDVYTIRSEVYGVELRVLVGGFTETMSKSGAAQSLSIRAIRVTPTRPVTYNDLEAAWTPGDYSGLQAAWAALDYAALDDDPLEGAPL